jgi:hypothetical protein
MVYVYLNFWFCWFVLVRAGVAQPKGARAGLGVSAKTGQRA